MRGVAWHGKDPHQALLLARRLGLAGAVRDGKEAGQGVAYLDDGTMIVVDGGKKWVGETVEVMVSSVLQTSAGRMIFARPNGPG